MMSYFFVALFGGFAGSVHCIGMCGGFACGLANVNTGSKMQLFAKTALYNLGRLVSYAFIGAMAGSLGAVLIGLPATDEHGSGNALEHSAMRMVLAGEAGLAQSVLSVIAGLLMIVMALRLLGIYRHVPASWGRFGGVAFARILNTLVQSNQPSAAVALGVANGFLPCPLVFAFAAVAAASGSVFTGLVIMLAFGLGTFPAMLLMGNVGMMLSPLLRQRGVWLSGVFVFVIGLLTVARGVVPGLNAIM